MTWWSSCNLYDEDPSKARNTSVDFLQLVGVLFHPYEVVSLSKAVFFPYNAHVTAHRKKFYKLKSQTKTRSGLVSCVCQVHCVNIHILSAWLKIHTYMYVYCQGSVLGWKAVCTSNCNWAAATWALMSRCQQLGRWIQRSAVCAWESETCCWKQTHYTYIHSVHVFLISWQPMCSAGKGSKIKPLVLLKFMRVHSVSALHTYSHRYVMYTRALCV